MKVSEGKFKDKIKWYFDQRKYLPIILAKSDKDLKKAIDDFKINYHDDLTQLLKLLKVKEGKNKRSLAKKIDEINNNKNELEKMEDIIITFFTKYKDPTDEQIHKLSDKIGIDKHEFEKTIYGLLSSFLYNGMYSESVRNGKEVNIIDTELKFGIDIEMEHTDNKKIAKRIALDHLAEFPDYYTRLRKMESETKNEVKEINLAEIRAILK